MRSTAAAIVIAACSLPAAAQETASSLALELNALEASATGCRITFLATNNLGTELTKAAFEIALFVGGGTIDRLVSLDFKTMPAGKTRVLQFDLSELDCAEVSRVLVNDVAACEGDGLDPGLCLAALDTRSNTSVVFGT